MKSATRLASCLIFALLLVGSLIVVSSCGESTPPPAEPVPDVLPSYEDLRPALDLPKTAEEVDALILSINKASIANEETIDRAFLAYWALSPEEQDKVLYFSVLDHLRSELTKEYVVKEYLDTRMPHNEFLLGVYVCQMVGPYLYTDYHMQALADCHFDYTWQADELDIHYKYGIGTFAWAPQVGIHAWPLPESEEAYRELVKDYNREEMDHPAVWAVFCADETLMETFSTIGMMSDIITSELLPDCGFMNNLLPIYAGTTGNYRQYVRAVANRVTSDFVCYDHYMYGYNNFSKNPSALTDSLENLEIVRETCQKYGKDLYVILQAFKEIPDVEDQTVSEEMLKFQGYCAMAHGAKSITWASWIFGWDESNILLDSGEKSLKYLKVRAANEAFLAMEPIYMRYGCTSTATLTGDGYIPEDDKLHSYIRKQSVDGLVQSSLVDLKAGAEDLVVVGAFTKNVGDGEAFMLVGAENYWFLEETVSTVTFKTADPAAVVTAYVNGQATVLNPDEQGVYTVSIYNADAVFITVD